MQPTWTNSMQNSFDKPIVVPPEVTELLKKAVRSTSAVDHADRSPPDPIQMLQQQRQKILAKQQRTSFGAPRTSNPHQAGRNSTSFSQIQKANLQDQYVHLARQAPAATLNHDGGGNEGHPQRQRVVYVPVLMVRNPEELGGGVSYHLITKQQSTQQQTQMPSPTSTPYFSQCLPGSDLQGVPNLENRQYHPNPSSPGSNSAAPYFTGLPGDIATVVSGTHSGVSPSSSLGSLSGIGTPAHKDQNKAVDTTKYKTTLCRKFEVSGFCPYGDICAYAHGLKELRSVAENNSAVHSLAILAEQMKAKMGPVPMSALGPVRHRKRNSRPTSNITQDPCSGRFSDNLALNTAALNSDGVSSSCQISENLFAMYSPQSASKAV